MRVLIFGNSGSGKSTLARQLADEGGLAHLDLDTLAWLPEHPPRRAPLGASTQRIEVFIDRHASWVIEGCYTDLLRVAAPFANEAVFLNLDVVQCVANARKRPWEPHKYESKVAQDANLDMLINWIRDYTEREDVFSYRAHRDFYERFEGAKRMYTNNVRRTLPRPPADGDPSRTEGRKVEFRSLQASDQSALWDWLHIALWDPPQAGLRPREVLDEPGVRIYAEEWGRRSDIGAVAVVDDTDAGACWMRVLPDGVGLASLDGTTPQLGIALNPPYQHRGLGEPLLREALGRAWRAGHRRVSLTVHPQNPAIPLYARCGFEKVEIRRGYHLMVAKRLPESA
ncbi:MAG TPA: GNAT family N-acetyltransferase [Woeseiaceae bacterium]|nr:GNAT family N-acetyltransferase [Woeseiaceae bacterium]